MNWDSSSKNYYYVFILSAVALLNVKSDNLLQMKPSHATCHIHKPTCNNSQSINPFEWSEGAPPPPATVDRGMPRGQVTLSQYKIQLKIVDLRSPRSDDYGFFFLRFGLPHILFPQVQQTDQVRIVAEQG